MPICSREQCTIKALGEISKRSLRPYILPQVPLVRSRYLQEYTVAVLRCTLHIAISKCKIHSSKYKYTNTHCNALKSTQYLQEYTVAVQSPFCTSTQIHSCKHTNTKTQIKHKYKCKYKCFLLSEQNTHIQIQKHKYTLKSIVEA